MLINTNKSNNNNNNDNDNDNNNSNNKNNIRRGKLQTNRVFVAEGRMNDKLETGELMKSREKRHPLPSSST